MKKTLALLMMATMLFTASGCGNKVEDAKKDAEQKVEQAKDAATAKVDEAKDAATAKVDEMKQDAAAIAEEVEEKIDELTDDEETLSEISLDGIAPGLTVEEVLSVYGQPVNTSGSTMTFANGAIVDLDATQKVKSVRLTTDEIETSNGISVGMSEYALNDVYGTADAVKQIAGGVEYEYHFGNGDASKLIFTTANGLISEIKSEYTK